MTGGGNLTISAGNTFTTSRMTTASTGLLTFGVGGGTSGELAVNNVQRHQPDQPC